MSSATPVTQLSNSRSDERAVDGGVSRTLFATPEKPSSSAPVDPKKIGDVPTTSSILSAMLIQSSAEKQLPEKMLSLVFGNAVSQREAGEASSGALQSFFRESPGISVLKSPAGMCGASGADLPPTLPQAWEEIHALRRMLAEAHTERVAQEWALRQSLTHASTDALLAAQFAAVSERESHLLALQQLHEKTLQLQQRQQQRVETLQLQVLMPCYDASVQTAAMDDPMVPVGKESREESAQTERITARDTAVQTGELSGGKTSKTMMIDEETSPQATAAVASAEFQTLERGSSSCAAGFFHSRTSASHSSSPLSKSRGSDNSSAGPPKVNGATASLQIIRSRSPVVIPSGVSPLNRLTPSHTRAPSPPPHPPPSSVALAAIAKVQQHQHLQQSQRISSSLLPNPTLSALHRGRSPSPRTTVAAGVKAATAFRGATTTTTKFTVMRSKTPPIPSSSSRSIKTAVATKSVIRSRTPPASTSSSRLLRGAGSPSPARSPTPVRVNSELRRPVDHSSGTTTTKVYYRSASPKAGVVNTSTSTSTAANFSSASTVTSATIKRSKPGVVSSAPAFDKENEIPQQQKACGNFCDMPPTVPTSGGSSLKTSIFQKARSLFSPTRVLQQQQQQVVETKPKDEMLVDSSKDRSKQPRKKRSSSEFAADLEQITRQVAAVYPSDSSLSARGPPVYSPIAKRLRGYVGCKASK